MVFVEEPAEQVASMHPAWLAVADNPQIGRWIRRFQSERPVRTIGVVVGAIDPEDLLQVTSPDDQEPVETLGADRADPALRMGVRVGCLYRCQEHLRALGAEHIVEAAGELRVAVVEEIADPASSFAEHPGADCEPAE
jgi:hypothetical protein